MAELGRLLRLSRAHAGALLAANACLAAASLLDVALLVLVRRALDAPGGSLRTIVGLGLGTAILRAAATSSGARLAQRSSVRLVGDLQNRVYERMHEQSLDFYDRTPVGDLLARLFHDVEAAARLVTGVAVGVVEGAVRLLVLCLALWTLHPPAAIATLAVVVPALVALRLLGRGLHARFDALYRELALVYETARDALSAPELVKTFARERAEALRFAQANGALLAREARLQQLQAFEAPLAEAARIAGVAAALVVGSDAVAAGTLSPGGLASILLAAWAFWGALDALGTAYATAQAGRAAAGRVLAMLDAAPSVVSPAAPQAPTFARELRFDGVSFGYPGRGVVLRDVSFAIRPGERVALVGPSGGGKTTLVRLLLRLFDPSAGRVLLDGADLRSLDLAGLRGLFAVVPQDTVLLDRSLEANVAYARADATREDVASAIAASALPLGPRFPEGLDTVVGARGVALSAGERQRVALARAILRAAPIVVLDEPTSGLDDETAARVQSAIDILATGRTVLVITHSPDRLPAGYRLLELREGRVGEAASSSRGLSQPYANSGE